MIRERIRIAREARELSLREASKRLGVHRVVLRRWERGIAVPMERDIPRLLLVLGVVVSSEELAAERGEPVEARA